MSVKAWYKSQSSFLFKEKETEAVELANSLQYYSIKYLEKQGLGIEKLQYFDSFLDYTGKYCVKFIKEKVKGGFTISDENLTGASRTNKSAIKDKKNNNEGIGNDNMPICFNSGDEVMIWLQGDNEEEIVNDINSTPSSSSSYITPYEKILSWNQRSLLNLTSMVKEKSQKEVEDGEDDEEDDDEDDESSEVKKDGTNSTLNGIIKKNTKNYLEILFNNINAIKKYEKKNFIVTLRINFLTFNRMENSIEYFKENPSKLLKFVIESEEEEKRKLQTPTSTSFFSPYPEGGLWLNKEPLLLHESEDDEKKKKENEIIQAGLSLPWFNPSINLSQKNAVIKTLNAKLISVIHGPPGTGKTSTLTEIILQCVSRGDRVLVTAPSNLAVDTIMQRVLKELEVFFSSPSSSSNSLSKKSYEHLTKAAQTMVRVGHPTRIEEDLLNHTLDAHIKEHEVSFFFLLQFNQFSLIFLFFVIVQ